MTTETRIEALIAPILNSLGYELVHLEFQTHRHRVLRVFIDHANTAAPAIGVEDCAAVSRAIDEPLETSQDPALAGGYELEVSSPGVDRPLRKSKDFQQFAGREARIHVFRPLTAEELGNSEYQTRNPKQKNFIGVLGGIDGERVKLSVSASMGSSKTSAKNEKRDEVRIPLELISKANLEPRFDPLKEERKK